MAPPTFQVQDLSVVYETDSGPVPAARRISLSVDRGETLGLVGESGSGKTTLALAAINYLPANGRVEQGASRLNGLDLLRLPKREMPRMWGSRIGLVSQDPRSAMNPTLTIGRQLDEMGCRHLGLGRREARDLALAMLGKMGMSDPPSVVGRYPHQLSGGMLQLCAIAMALLTHPEVVILDEPTTSLDVTTQATVLDVLTELKTELQTAALYITHNLGVIARVADRVAVMYAGEMLETAGVKALFARPLHPYTLNLLRCVPHLGAGARAERPKDGKASGITRATAAEADASGIPSARLASIPGSLPPWDDLPRGCIFAPRCPLVMDFCRVSRPPLVEVEPLRWSTCLRWQVLLSDEGRAQAVSVETRAGVPPLVEDTRSRGPLADGGLQPSQEAVSVPVLEVKDATKAFGPARSRAHVKAVDGASLSVPQARTFGLVGESGSGKTTLARVIAGLELPSSGRIFLAGESLKPSVGARGPHMLRRLQMVFQSPDGSFNPRMTVGRALMRPLMIMNRLDRKNARERALELLEAVRVPASHFDRYPSELSGGEKQRVAIARAFAGDPDIVLCDEPISSLDVSVQSSVINLLADLQEEAGTAYLFISHDLAVVEHLSHRVGVMYLGKLMEIGEVAKVLAPPYHPYSEALLSAVPVPDPTAASKPVRLHVSVSSSLGIPSGCRFHPRCPRYLGDICRLQAPPWRLSDGRVIPALAPTSAAGPDRPAEAAHSISCHIPLEELVRLQGAG